MFHHQIEHREESSKYDAQQTIFDELRGVSSGDETLRRTGSSVDDGARKSNNWLDQ